MERGADDRGWDCISCGCPSGVVSGFNSACGVGGCNSIYAWLRIGWPSSNASGWNSIYAWLSGGGDSSNASGCNSSYSWSWISVGSQSRKGSGCQPSTGCNSTKRRYSQEVERDARGRSHVEVEGEARTYPAMAKNAPGWTTRGSCKGFHGPPASTERTTASPRFAPAAPHGNTGGRRRRRGRARSAGASYFSGPRLGFQAVGDRQVVVGRSERTQEPARSCNKQ